MVKNYMIALIDTIDKVKEFVNIAQKSDKDIMVKSGCYVVNGKSIMGLFSLNVEKPLEVFYKDGVEDSIRNELNKFEIK